MSGPVNPIEVSFHNRQYPNAGFDLLRIEDLHARKDLDHSPYQLHRVDFFLILLIEAGRGQHTIDFITYDYIPGTLLTIRKDQLHRFHPCTETRGYMLLFTSDFLVSYLEAMEARKSFQLFNEVLSTPVLHLADPVLQEIWELTQRIRHEYLTEGDEYSLAIIRSELQILFAKLSRIKTRTRQFAPDRKYLERFTILQELIERHVTEYPRVSHYAQLMGVSTKTLNKVTRSIVHKSAKEFIDDIRTKQIKRLLINTELSVKEIAYTAGFLEPTNFYKYFRRQTGTTPEQFRKHFG
ncbi:MAG: helix-turn-helix transcriptional regulator [Bacteroidota bacterium]